MTFETKFCTHKYRLQLCGYARLATSNTNFSIEM